MLTIAVFGAMLGCSNEEESNDPQFCECMEIGQQLSDYSSDLLERTPTAEDEKKMQELREKSTRECGKYYEMSGEEMLKRKKLCK